MNRSFSLFPFFIIALFLVTFPTSSPAQTARSGEKVSLQLQWKHQFEFAGFYAALEKGFYSDAGLDVELKEYNQGFDILGSVLSGESTFGVLYSNVIKARMEGKPVVLLANYFKRSPLAFVTSPDIFYPGELKNATIMAEQHEIDSPNFHQMFKQFNITPKDFKVVPHTYSIDQFINGEVDAMTVFLTNEVFHLRERKIPFNLIDPNNYGVPLYDVNLFTSEDFASVNPELTRAFIEASNQGWEYALSHPEEIIDLIYTKYNTQNKTKAHLRFEAEETKLVVLRKLFPIGSIDPEQIRKIQELFIVRGVADNVVPPEDFVFDLASPNSLSLSPAEQAYLQHDRFIRVIRSFNEPPFTLYDENGLPTGYLYDLLTEVLKISGLKAKFVDGFDTYEQMIQAVQVGSADILLSMHNARQLSGSVVRTVPVVTSPYVLVGKNTSPQIRGVTDLFGRKVAVVRGYAQDTHLDKFPKIIKVHVKDNEDGFAAVRQGRADYFLNNLENSGYILQKEFATDLRIAGDLPYNDFPPLKMSFAIHSRHPELQAIINKALAAVPLSVHSRLRAKWLTANIEFSSHSLPLSPAEKSYLSGKKQITMCVDPNWMPYERIDEKGHHVGLAADYFSFYRQMIPVPFRLIATSSREESLENARARKCDILSLVNKAPEYSSFLNYTAPYIHSSVVLAARNDVVYLDGLNSLTGKTLAVVRDHAYTDTLRTNFPKITLIPADSLAEGLQMVSDGSVFAAVGSLLSILTQIQEQGLSNLKIAGSTKLKNELRIGVRNDDYQLLSILNKAVQALDKETESGILRRWYTVSVEEKFDYSLILKISGLAIIILGLVLYWNRRLRTMNEKLSDEISERQRAEKALEQVNQELQQLAAQDGLTLVANRRYFDQTLQQEWQRMTRQSRPLALLLCDIDYFKQYNDHYGHPAGDECLKQVAAALRDTVHRPGDLVARYGGEEFVVLLPDTDLEGSMEIARKIADNIAHLDIRHEQSEAGNFITLSIGVAEMIPARSLHQDILVAAADKALYEAKRVGRNKIVPFSLL